MRLALVHNGHHPLAGGLLPSRMLRARTEGLFGGSTKATYALSALHWLFILQTLAAHVGLAPC